MALWVLVCAEWQAVLRQWCWVIVKHLHEDMLSTVCIDMHDYEGMSNFMHGLDSGMSMRSNKQPTTHCSRPFICQVCILLQAPA